MAQVNNFILTAAELNVAMDQSFILTKHEVVRKISGLFGELERNLKADIDRYELSQTDVNISAGKIFRGENYRQFPYVLLDYPRLFNTKTIFAFRTMFWWGNEFSFTFHLQGEAWLHYQQVVMKNLARQNDETIYCCVNDSPWQYHFEQENYRLLKDLIASGKFAELQDKPFLKLSRKLPIQQTEEVLEYGTETFHRFLSLLK